MMLSIVLALFNTSCGGSDSDPVADTEAPTIEFVKPNIDGSTSFSRGTPMDVDLTFKDNMGLEKCVVTITYPIQASTSELLKGIGSPWQPAENGEEFTIEFDGETEKQVTTDLFTDPIEVSCLSGTYVLTFVLEDTSANTATETITVTID